MGKQWRQLSLKFRPNSFLDIVKIHYTNSVLTFFKPDYLLFFSNIGWRSLNITLPHSCLPLEPFPCQLSRNLVCYTCLPPRIQWILPQRPESTTQLSAGQFQPCHEQVSPVSIICSIDGTCQTLTIWKQPRTHTSTHTHTHTHGE